MTLIEQEFVLKKYQEKLIDLRKFQDLRLGYINEQEEKRIDEVTKLCIRLQRAFDENLENACKEMIKKYSHE
jgi:hypothetical protein